MPPINLILNGTFDDGSANWTGTDLETDYTEDAYLGNGSGNRVSELDGNGFPDITVMEQTFTVDTPTVTELTFDVALRVASKDDAGLEGFTVEVVDSLGNVVASDTVLPTTSTLEPYALALTFASAGDYTLRFTELGPNNSFGAIIDNVEIMYDDTVGIVCFCDGTLIRTDRGDVAVEDLQVGDMVETQSGLKPLRWIGKRRVSARDQEINPKLRPVRIEAGALGLGLPSEPLRVSRQHRMVVSSRLVERMFDTPQALVAANKLVGLPGIELASASEGAEYFHLLFDEHEIIFANDAPSESFLVTSQSVRALSQESLEELRTLFPDLEAAGNMIAETTLTIPPLKRQRKLVERMAKNQRTPLEQGQPESATAYPN